MQLYLDSSPPSQRYLIGVSGGRDSVALLHALHAQGFQKLIVCHVNHKLRGKASTQDAAFVKKLATRLGYPFENSAVDVAKRAKTDKQSIETCARIVRHEVFAAMARKHRCPRIFLAHHAEDQAETVLMRILRGTGLAGLAGMKPETEVTVGKTKLVLLRPMLALRRAEVDAYIAEHLLKFREDESNADSTPTRNLLRNDLLPMLSTALGREVTAPLLRLSATAKREDDFVRLVAVGLIEDEALIQDDGSLGLKRALKEAHSALQHRVLHTWLEMCGVPDLSAEIIEQGVRLITHEQPSRINLPLDLQLCRKAGRLWIQEQ